MGNALESGDQGFEELFVHRKMPDWVSYLSVAHETGYQTPGQDQVDIESNPSPSQRRHNRVREGNVHFSFRCTRALSLSTNFIPLTSLPSVRNT